MRSVAGYVLAPILGLGLLAAGIVVLVLGITGYGDKVEDFDRIDVEDGVGRLTLDEGDYSIYWEPSNPGAEDLSSAYRQPPLVVGVDRLPGVERVGVDDYDSDVTYDVSGRNGVGLYTFTAEEAGEFGFSVVPLSAGGQLAIGPGIGTGFAGSLVAGIGLIGLGPLVGLVLAVATFVRRSRARRTVAPAR